MHIRTIQTALLVLTLLPACGGRPTSVAPTPTPWLLEEGESGRLPLNAGGEPTVETPYLQLNLDVTDKQTGKHVHSAVIAVDGHELGRGCCLQVVIEATGPHTLTVEAAGYVPWSVELDPHIQHHTVMTAPVQLKPLKPEARHEMGRNGRVTLPTGVQAGSNQSAIYPKLHPGHQLGI